MNGECARRVLRWLLFVICGLRLLFWILEGCLNLENQSQSCFHSFLESTISKMNFLILGYLQAICKLDFGLGRGC